MVIGLTILQGGAVGAAYLAAVFISNLPEAISSTSGLVSGGWPKPRILWMWIAIALVSGLASLAAGVGGPLAGRCPSRSFVRLAMNRSAVKPDRSSKLPPSGS